MTITAQIAKHLREVINGSNWTDVNLRDTLKDVDRKTATTSLNGSNSIAMLVYHIHYYYNPVLRVLQGGQLESADKNSFNLPPIQSEEDWQRLVEKVYTDTEVLASQIEQLEDSLLDDIFVHPKYGSYYRNLHGIIEHTYYHLGQIVLLKKLLNEEGGNS